MSELTRRAIRALPRLAVPSTSGGPDRSRTTRVVVRAPQDLLDRHGDEAAAILTDALHRLCRELGVDTVPTTTTEGAPSRHPEVAISVDGRPVALVPADELASSGRPVDALRCHVLHGVLRRLPLLARPEAGRGVAAVLSVGCALPRPPLGHVGPPQVADLQAAERVIDERAAQDVVLQVPPDAMRRVDDAGLRAVADFRETEFRKRGIRYPDVRVELGEEGSGTMTVRLNDVTLPPIALPDDAGWAYVAGRLGREMALRRHWFVRVGQVDRLLNDDLEYLFPELVAATRSAFSQEEVAACLRELLRSGRRIRNLPRIMWLMLEQGDAHGGADMLRLSESPLTPTGGSRRGATRDPVVLAARVRKIAAEEAWRLGNHSLPAAVRRLPADLEERLVGAAGRPGVGAAEWQAVRALQSEPAVERLVTRTIEAIGPVRDAVSALDRPIRVLASQELPPDVDVDRFAVVGEGGRSRDRAHHGPDHGADRGTHRAGLRRR